jgi:hypothetical protein
LIYGARISRNNTMRTSNSSVSCIKSSLPSSQTIDEKARELVKNRSRMFQLYNKQIIKENMIKSTDLETILKEKSELTEMDKVRKIYFSHIETKLQKAQ